MKSKVRILWMKLHAYFACFFLPVTLLYVVTGVLYLFDIKGGVKEEFKYPLALTQGWPESQQAAQHLVEKKLAGLYHPALPEDYYPEEGGHDWYGFKQEVILISTDDASQARLIIKEHDVWHQLLLIHKGHAGKLFWLFGIFLGVSLFFSLVSGFVLVFQMPKLKGSAFITFVAGTLVLALLFFEGDKFVF